MIVSTGSTALPVGGLEPRGGPACPPQEVIAATSITVLNMAALSVVTGLPQGSKGSSFVPSMTFTCSNTIDPSSAMAGRMTLSGVPLHAAAGEKAQSPASRL